MDNAHKQLHFDLEDKTTGPTLIIEEDISLKALIILRTIKNPPVSCSLLKKTLLSFGKTISFMLLINHNRVI